MTNKLILTRLGSAQLPMIPPDQFRDRTLSIMQVGYTPLNVIERAWIGVQHPRPDEGHKLWSKPFQSCVPLGEYELVLRDSPAHGKRWHFVNEERGIYLEKSDCPDLDDEGEPVNTRYSCMFHPANYWRDVVGCAGMGMALVNFGMYGSQKGWGVSSSRAATAILEQYLGSGPTRLIIR